MPTQAEYESRFEAITNPILDQPYKNRGEVNHLGSLAKHALMTERNKATKEISERWRETFKVIKEENDEWQKALKLAYEATYREIGADLGEKFEGLQR